MYMLQAPKRLFTAMWLQAFVFRAVEVQQRLTGRSTGRCTSKMHSQLAVSFLSHCWGGIQTQVCTRRS